jgi:hypothetical protein
VKDNATIVRKKIVPLLNIFAPSVVVVKRVSGLRGVARRRNKEIMDALEREAQERSLEFVVLKRSDIRRAFLRSGKRSKYAIASLITELFPELSWKLPLGRKNWEPEHHNMTIFDALSGGLAYLAQCGDTDGPAQPQTLSPG